MIRFRILRNEKTLVGETVTETSAAEEISLKQDG